MSDVPMSARMEGDRTALKPRQRAGKTGATETGRYRATIRRVGALVVVAVSWQIAASMFDNPILFPSFGATLRALFESLRSDDLARAAFASLLTLTKGYVIAISLGLALVSIAAVSSLFKDMLEALSVIFNPLPAIALLPIAMLWFGLGEKSLIFVLVHAVLWPFTVAVVAGLEQVPQTLRLVGRNYGLTGFRFVALILVPASMPTIISGLKVAWAFAWRTLIASELVFGVSSGQGGLGWFIYRNRNELSTDKAFAGLLAVIAIGLVIEIVAFKTLERVTVKRWHVQTSTSD